VDKDQPENVLVLGSIYPCPPGWCAIVEEFPGHLNLHRQQLDYRHGMKQNSHAKNCTDEFLTTIHGAELPAKLKVDGDETIIETGGYRYVWRKDQVVKTGFLLSDVVVTAPIAVPYSQPVGFLFASDDARDIRFERGQFNAYFEGNLAHKNMLKGVQDDWELSRTSLDFRKFSVATALSPVLGLTQSGLPDVLKRYKKPFEAHHSILPPQGESRDHLRFFNHEYGHDFNANGCFDDFGHNKMMLPIVSNNLISAFVFVEYTYDKKDGVPMLSVGRYFRK
jgi:hypothetical protein